VEDIAVAVMKVRMAPKNPAVVVAVAQWKGRQRAQSRPGVFAEALEYCTVKRFAGGPSCPDSIWAVDDRDIVAAPPARIAAGVAGAVGAVLAPMLAPAGIADSWEYLEILLWATAPVYTSASAVFAVLASRREFLCRKSGFCRSIDSAVVHRHYWY